MLSDTVLQESGEASSENRCRKIGLINVGANTSHGALKSPLFANGEFEFIPIPDLIMDYLKAKNAIRYKDLKPANGRRITDFLKDQYHDMSAHGDPEFETRTYGDYPTINPRASNLRKLSKGDLLFFFARLVEWRNGRFTKKAGFYIIGGIEIAKIYKNLTESPPSHIYKRIKRNAHVIRGDAAPPLYDGFWIFKGTRRLGRFKYAVSLDRQFIESCQFTDRKSETWKWHRYKSELSAIGSYLRSSKVIEDRYQVSCFCEAVSRHNHATDVQKRMLDGNTS